MTCPNCLDRSINGVIIDHDFLDEKAIITLDGICDNCHKRYMWNEYYLFESEGFPTEIKS